jgi:hypothetical protein
MAAAVATFTITQHWTDTKALHVIGKLVISASPATYTTGGIALNWQNPLIKASTVPVWHEIVAETVSTDPTYDYVFVSGTSQTNCLLKIFTGGAELTSASSIPAGVSGDLLIKLYMIFRPQLV